MNMKSNDSLRGRESNGRVPAGAECPRGTYIHWRRAYVLVTGRQHTSKMREKTLLWEVYVDCVLSSMGAFNVVFKGGKNTSGACDSMQTWLYEEEHEITSRKALAYEFSHLRWNMR